MRITLILVLTLLLLQVCTDAYLFFVALRRSRKLAVAKFQLYESAFFLIYAVVILCFPARTGASEGGLQALMWLIFVYLLVYASKLTFVLFDLLSQVPVLFGRRRLKWLGSLGVVASAAVALTLMWAAFVNRVRLQVNEIPVHIENLPQSFAGYRIAQISDLHLGTFGSDTAFVARMVDRINGLHPDLIVFTGDIVNQRAAEAEPFVSPLSRLRARDGVFSILGNHDYGDYVKWKSPQEKEENLERLMDLQIEMGWELLTNSSEVIAGDAPADSLVIVGVENWGDAPFPRYGDLETAYPALADSATKVLLTHNPRHWTDIIAPNDTMNIALTLSGHTHAMQMEVAGVSPAALRYPDCWGGTYVSPDGRKTLYVNIGAGTVGFPMRIGATPEITIFTLHPKR